MKKKNLYILIAIVAAALATGGFFYLKPASGEKKADLAVKTAQVKKGDLEVRVAATGTVMPEAEIIVKSKAGGEITSFPFNEGDNVKKGEVIVRLDPKTETARVNQAHANLSMSEARLEKARVTVKDAAVKLARSKTLFSEGIISRQELENAELEHERAGSDQKVAEAELLQKREALSEESERLSDTRIKAPLTGTILIKFVDVGQVISSTISSASEGTQIFSMADLTRMYVTAQVDEVDVAAVRPGVDAVIAADSLPGAEFEGRVLRIAPKGKAERTVTVFDVTVEITDSKKSQLKPGMSADVKILVDSVKGALLVPKEALKVKDGVTGVYIQKDGKTEFTKVEAGKTDGMMTEVRGIREGDMVVTSNISNNESKARPKRGFMF